MMLRILVLLLLAQSAAAQVYQVKLNNGSASAVCVGINPPCFITAKHVVSDAREVAVSDGSNWYRALRIATDSTEDLATFETIGGNFRATGLVEDVPEGVDVTACGWTPERQAFCWTAAVYGDWLHAKNNTHSQPGDSGGGAFVETARGKCLVGMHVGYSCDRRSGNRCETLIVPSARICRFLRTQYGSCPTCPQYIPPQPLRRPTPSQPRQTVPQQSRPSGDLLPGGCTVVVDYDRVAREVVDRYGDKLKGRDGRDGTNGADGRSPELDLDQLADVITQRYADRIRGPAGQRGADGIGKQGPAGPQGERGLVGVPDEADIRNWLVGAMSDPSTRQQLTVILADLVAADPRTEDLIRRLEAVEARKNSQRVLLVDGSNGTVIDDETYTNEPIVLDVRKFMKSGN